MKIDKKRFAEILKEEGIVKKSLIDDIWKSRPEGDLVEWKVRAATKFLVGKYGKEFVNKEKGN